MGDRPDLNGVSIHAPARGATALGHKVTWDEATFQSTHPRGVRQFIRYRRGRDINVSIHAPARGATWGLLRGLSKEVVSIHAPARGATPFFFFFLILAFVSIHAPARGATV